MKNIVIIGATSAIAEQIARDFASKNARLFLLARNQKKLDAIKDDLLIRGAKTVNTMPFDASDHSNHEACVEAAFDELHQVDSVICAHGTLPDQTACEIDAKKALNAININGVSFISLLTHIANKMESQKSGNITVITSVAGDRGRQSNYVYGSAKSLVSTYLQGLAQRLFKSGIHVLDIKPGFVDTPMTADFDKGGPLWSKPDTVGKAIVKKIEKRRNFSYLPWFWFGIMSIIKTIPRFVFNRLKL